MKSIKNYLLAVLALVAILTVVSCKNEDDDKGPSESVIYTNGGVKVTFYDNYTFRMEGDSAVLEGTYVFVEEAGDVVLDLTLTKATSGGQAAPEQTLPALASVWIGGNGTSNKGKGTVNDDGTKLTLGYVTYTLSE